MWNHRYQFALLFGLGLSVGTPVKAAAFLEPLPTEMTSISAVEMARRIRYGEITSTHLIEAHLARIRELNGELQAIVTESATAMDEAAAADRLYETVFDNALEATLLEAEVDVAEPSHIEEARRRVAEGEALPPFHGVPITIKDSFDTAGLRSTWGTVGRAEFVPDTSATVVTRLVEAGFIILGKTQTPEFTMGFRGVNNLFPETRNPYSRRYSSGGSSSGECAGIAAGFSPAGIGSDTLGSLRYPASLCGVVSLKPTRGRIPLTGHAIASGNLAGTMTQVGPIARYVEDVEALLRLMMGSDGFDTETPDVMPELGDYRQVSMESLRVGFYTRSGNVEANPRVAQAVEESVGALEPVVRSSGVVTPPTGIDYLSILTSTPGYFSGLLNEAGTTSADITQDMRNTMGIPGENPSTAARNLENYRERFLELFVDHDVILSPVYAEAEVIGDPNMGSLFTMAHNLTGFPAAVVPVGIGESGMPIGVQIVGRPWEEDVVLAVAGFLEAECGGWRLPGLYIEREGDTLTIHRLGDGRVTSSSEIDGRFRRVDGNPIQHSGETAFFRLQ